MGEAAATVTDHGGRMTDLGLRLAMRGVLGLRRLAARGDTAASIDQTAGRALLKDVYSIDLHAHPGLIPALASGTLEHHGRALRAGGVGAVVLAVVGDLPVLGWRPRRSVCAVRTPRPGELFQSTWQQLDRLDREIRRAGLRPLSGEADLAGAAERREGSCLLAIEGCDFLEGRLDRIRSAYDRGVRVGQLVHYRVNELGDIQTEAPVHHGLTRFGRQVVREMNRLGMVIDLSHATFEVVRNAVETSTQPVIVSHTNLQDASGVTRFVSHEHARLVAAHGGVLGAWPFSLGAARFTAFVEHIARLADVVGVDHVGVGTDLDGTGPYGLFDDYAQWPAIPAALLTRGFTRDDVSKIVGANFRRVLSEVDVPRGCPR